MTRVPGAGRPVVVMADGPNGPLPDPASLRCVAGLADPDIVVGWIVRTPAWFSGEYRVTTLMTGVGTKEAVRTGAIRAVPTRLSAVPGILGGWLRPTVAVVAAVADGSGYRFAPGIGWAPEAARYADAVAVEVVDPATALALPAAFTTPRVEGNIVEVIDRADPPDPVPASTAGAVERRIAALVAGLIPEGATIQWGPGKIGAAVAAALNTPVAVRSGLVTDELVTLANRGLLCGAAEAAYLWGGPELYGLVAGGRLRMRPVSSTHDLSALSTIPRFVAINTALQVGLDGSANVEGLRSRPVSGPGGHPDFAAAASRSPGGLSIVALASTFGDRSAIVGRTDVVSTPGFDVDMVVTEHGVAELRGASPGERAERLAAIADPAHRSALAEQ